MTARKLKVFQTQLGFHDTVVAAPSQAAALRAWEIHQNLFASGEAKVTTDEAAVAAATAHPETPLRRAVGSSDPFALKPTGRPEVRPDPKKDASRASLRARAKPPAPPADRSKLAAAEKALGELDARREREEADFRREAEALEQRRVQAQNAYDKARKAATAEAAHARTAYRKAGGND